MGNGKSHRGFDGRFKKGQSGNPGGRPKALTEIKQAAREHSEGYGWAVHVARSAGPLASDRRGLVEASNRTASTLGVEWWSA